VSGRRILVRPPALLRRLAGAGSLRVGMVPVPVPGADWVASAECPGEKAECRRLLSARLRKLPRRFGALGVGEGAPGVGEGVGVTGSAWGALACRACALPRPAASSCGSSSERERRSAGLAVRAGERSARREPYSCEGASVDA
jgi:hypothetical protein